MADIVSAKNAGIRKMALGKNNQLLFMKKLSSNERRRL